MANKINEEIVYKVRTAFLEASRLKDIRIVQYSLYHLYNASGELIEGMFDIIRECGWKVSKRNDDLYLVSDGELVISVYFTENVK